MDARLEINRLVKMAYAPRRVYAPRWAYAPRKASSQSRVYPFPPEVRNRMERRMVATGVVPGRPKAAPGSGMTDQQWEKAWNDAIAGLPGLPAGRGGAAVKKNKTSDMSDREWGEAWKAAINGR